MKTVLSELIYPRINAEFFEAYAKNKHFVVHGSKDSILELTSLPFLESLEALLNSWPEQIQAH